MTQPLDERLAGRGRRLVATLIDMLLVPALTALLVMITGVMEHAAAYRNSMWMLNVFLLAVLSYLILNGYWLFTKGRGWETIDEVVAIGKVHRPHERLAF
jgi:hypothetical protein